MYCPTCGTQNDDGARYCKKCGAALPTAASKHIASHLDTDGDGVPDVLESPTTLMGGAAAAPTPVMGSSAPTTVMGTAAPTTVMASPEAEPALDQTRVAPRSYTQQRAQSYAYAPAPAPEPAPRKRGGKGILAAVLAVIVLVCASFGVMYWRNYQAEQEAAERARQEQEAEQEAAEKAAAEKRLPHNVVLPLSAEGLDASGSRIPVYIGGTDFEGNAIELTAYVDYRGMGISVPKGSYEVTVLASPIAADGTLYATPGTFAFEIPENQTNGSDFEAPGTFVFTPLAAEDYAGAREGAIAYASQDPDMESAVLNVLKEAIDAKMAAASDAADQAARDDAIREATEKGRVVLTGTVHVMNGRELGERQNIDIDQAFGEWAKVEEETTYVIVVFDHETAFECMSGDGSGLRSDTATMISLTRQDPTYWSEREGEKVTIAVSPDETWWPSDVSLPAGEPRTAFVQVID